MSNRLYRKLMKRILILGLSPLEKYYVQCGNKQAAINHMVEKYGIKRSTATKMVGEYWREVYSY